MPAVQAVDLFLFSTPPTVFPHIEFNRWQYMIMITIGIDIQVFFIYVRECVPTARYDRVSAKQQQQQLLVAVSIMLRRSSEESPRSPAEINDQHAEA